MAGVKLEGLRKRFGAETVIDNIHLEVREGEFITLLGPSGCGKTTTLRIIAGFVSPDSGRVFLDQKDVTTLPTQKRKLGMVFQDYALFPHLTIADNVGFALRERGAAKADIARRVKELLALIRLPDVGDRLPSELSGGQQQRIALARAIAHTPSVLLMDEPLGALDLKLREVMQDELYEIQRKLGITTIYVTHDQEEALSLSHRIALMRGGRIVQLDTPKQIYAAPRSAFAAFFLGKVNFLQGRVMSKADGAYRVAVAGGATLTCPVQAEHERLELDAHILLGVRPQHLQLTTGAPPAGHNVLGGRITHVKFIGKIVECDVEVCGGTSMVVDGSLSEAEASGVGANVQLAWDPTLTRIFPFAEDPEIGLETSIDIR